MQIEYTLHWDNLGWGDNLGWVSIIKIDADRFNALIQGAGPKTPFESDLWDLCTMWGGHHDMPSNMYKLVGLEVFLESIYGGHFQGSRVSIVPRKNADEHHTGKTTLIIST